MTWSDLNGDANIDSGELTIKTPGKAYTTGDILSIVKLDGPPNSFGKVRFTDLVGTINHVEELTIIDSGAGFVSGPVTITQGDPASNTANAITGFVESL